MHSPERDSPRAFGTHQQPPLSPNHVTPWFSDEKTHPSNPVTHRPHRRDRCIEHLKAFYKALAAGKSVLESHSMAQSSVLHSANLGIRQEADAWLP